VVNTFGFLSDKAIGSANRIRSTVCLSFIRCVAHLQAVTSLTGPKMSLPITKRKVQQYVSQSMNRVHSHDRLSVVRIRKCGALNLMYFCPVNGVMLMSRTRPPFLCKGPRRRSEIQAVIRFRHECTVPMTEMTVMDSPNPSNACEGRLWHDGAHGQLDCYQVTDRKEDDNTPRW
jgi:hypothetical protein